MDTAVTQEKIQEIAEKIAKEYQPEKIILFGSWAWGEPGPDSDVDLFIIKKTDKRRLERGVEVERILWGSGIPIDALIYTPQEVENRLRLEDFFFEDVVKNGKILYHFES